MPNNNPLPDYRYFIMNLVARNYKADSYALLNFYYFLLHTSYKSKDYKLYQLKLQWLIDSLKSDEIKIAPDIDAIKILTYQYQFNFDDLITMVNTKTIDLDNFPFNSLEHIYNYSKNTEGLLWRMFANMINIKDQDVLAIIQDYGSLLGIVYLINESFHLKRKSVYLMLFQNQTTVNKHTEVLNMQYLIQDILQRFNSYQKSYYKDLDNYHVKLLIRVITIIATDLLKQIYHSSQPSYHIKITSYLRIFASIVQSIKI